MPPRRYNRRTESAWHKRALAADIRAAVGPLELLPTETPEAALARLLSDVAAHLWPALLQAQDGQFVSIVFHVDVLTRDGAFPWEPNARKSPEATEWRQRVFARDNFTCQDCGERGGRLHADHIQPWATHPGLRFTRSNGRTLCVECHAAKHPEHAALIRKARYHAPRA